VVFDCHGDRHRAICHGNQSGQSYTMALPDDSRLLGRLRDRHDSHQYLSLHSAVSSKLGSERREVQAFRILCYRRFRGRRRGAEEGIQRRAASAMARIAYFQTVDLGYKFVVDNWRCDIYRSLVWHDLGSRFRRRIWIIIWIAVRLDWNMGVGIVVMGDTGIAERTAMVFEDVGITTDQSMKSLPLR